MSLEQFNDAPSAEAERLLRPCLDIDRWVDEIEKNRPFATPEALLEHARSAAHPFSPQEIEGALAHHPRIGERAAGTSTEAGMSRSEQAGVDQQDHGTVTALAQGNRDYEKKFGRVFLIRAAGRSAEEILAALHGRLGHTPEQEEAIVAEQLREIAVLRLEQSVLQPSPLERSPSA
ncbi:2-oxo-4-hydroxy-4-carboxy-5-ureidoimidazoline decarboxylase [Sinomonas halotolerans]|uniref:2-oxo-4-hydroxy-4-carboxy-5-ureidoimidazoline decarboxylase n=1 Tax=Sinomonas halotolerans TaxID=1644133 RepID=A0ABU9X1C5_9MICC